MRATKVRYKKIAGCEGYRVGDDGSVWTRWVRHWPSGCGRGCKYRLGAWRQLKPTLNNRYYIVNMPRPGGGRVLRKVHHLVLEAFGPARKPGQIARHGKAGRLNNSIGNLRWGSSQDNSDDMRDHGTIVRGEKHHAAKLTEAKVRTIRRELRARRTQADLAEQFGVSKQLISAIAKRVAWGHVK